MFGYLARRRVVIWTLGAVGVALVLATRAEAVTITEIQKGLAASPSVGAPTSGPDGYVWFTDIGAVGKISSAGAITEYGQGIPAGDTPADSITLGSDGALWFCLTGASPAIGRIDPNTGQITHFALASNPSSVTEGPDGNVWFIAGSAAIGYITPSGTVTELTSGFTSGTPEIEAIAPGPGKTIWFLDNGSPYSVGHVDLSKTPYALSETSAGVDPLAVLGNLTAGPDGNVWFTASDAIGKVTSDGTVTETMAGSGGLHGGAVPDQITSGPDGNVWFDDQQSGADAIGKIDPSTGSITEYSLKTTSVPWTIAFGSDGDIYAAQTGQVVRMTTGGSETDFLTPSNTTGADNDVMVEGPDGNVYYNDFGSHLLVQVNLDEQPSVSTGAASGVTDSSATVSGSVTPLTAPTTVSVSYGTTTALGSSVAAGTLPASATAAGVSAVLTGLPASSIIYYKLLASNANGTVAGAITSFTTRAASIPTTPTTPTTTTPTPTPTPKPSPSVTTAKFGNQLLRLTAPSAHVCLASSARLHATFSSSRIRGTRRRLRFDRVTFRIDRGIRHRHHKTIRKGTRRRRITVLTYLPNATIHSAPASVNLTLTGLKRGAHKLTVKGTYTETVGHGRHKHAQNVGKTLTARFTVC